MRKVHHVIQGSDEWLTLRDELDGTASEANVVMGTSKYETRDQMLERKKTGAQKEITPFMLKLFDDGHKAEAAIRPFLEELTGEELFPATITDEIEGLKLGASFDNITMLEDDAAEVKLWNKTLAEAVAIGEVPESHYWQLEQQCLIGGFESMLFVVTDGTPEKTVYTRYHSTADRRKKLIAGWKQFAEDLKNYTPKDTKPQVVADGVMDLPTVFVQVQGDITIRENFDEFERDLTAFLDTQLITKPKTDQDFATLDLQIKVLKRAEDALQKAEGDILAQVDTIDKAKRRKDMLHKLARDNRLMAEKLLEAEKKARRNEILQGGVKALAEHVDGLNKRLGKPYMPAIPADFTGVMKGKKTIASLESAVNDELARCKILASEQADKLEANLKLLDEHAGEYKALFADEATIVHKEPDDLLALIKTRIADHKAAEEKKAEELREKIRAEEQAKAQREAEAKQEKVRIQDIDTVPAQARMDKPAFEPISDQSSMSSTREFIEKDIKHVVDGLAEMARKNNRPSANEILELLCRHFGAEKATVIGWLADMDLEQLLESAA